MSDATTTIAAPPPTQGMVPSLRTLAPRILIAGVLPLVAYTLLRPHLASDAMGLALVSVFPLADIAIERIRHGRFEPIGMIALIGITAGIISALAFHGDATMLKIRESVFTGLFGLVCLASLPARRPTMFYLGRAFATAGDADKVAEFDTIWDLPGVPARFRFITALWGVALVGEAVLRTVLAVSVSTQRFLEISPVMGWTVLGGLLWFTTRFSRESEARVLAASEATAAEA
jgi:predicted amino acid-binding ACT domain protein